MEPETSPIKAMECPVCRHQMDSATSISPLRNRPKKGDYTVCIDCGVIGKFKDGLEIYIPDPEEAIADFTEDAELAERIALAQSLILERNAKSQH